MPAAAVAGRGQDGRHPGQRMRLRRRGVGGERGNGTTGWAGAFGNAFGGSLTSASVGATLRDEDSGYFAALYRNQADDTDVDANRGTNEGKDWTHNFLQTVGGRSLQYERALDNARFVAQSDIARNVTFTGQSLGGGLASAQSVSTGIAGMTFNAAGLNPVTIGSLGAGRMVSQPDLLRAYYVKGELLSTLQDDGPKVAEAPLAALGSPLAGMAAFATLSKLPQAGGQRIAMDAVTNPAIEEVHGVPDLHSQHPLQAWPWTCTA